MAPCCSSLFRSTDKRSAALWFGLLLSALAPAARAQTLSNVTPLSFGSFTAGLGGTVIVSNGGVRSKTGAVLLVNQGGTASAAQINVSGGTSSASVAITLPADGTVTLTDGVNTMSVDGFNSTPNATGLLSVAGSMTINIGATLSVNSAQVPGNYTGSFNISVDYN